MRTVTFAVRRLVPSETERALLALQQASGEQSARGSSSDEDLHVDLSAVDWVEIGSAAQLVLQIEDWARSGWPVRISLPATTPLQDDRSELDRARRSSAKRFLRYIRFQAALEQMSSRRSLTLAFHSDGNDPTNARSDNEYPETYKRVVPLHWIEPDDHVRRQQLSEHLTTALRNSGEGVDGPDAEALANVVLHELVENVKEHARAGDAALVCGFSHTRALSGVQSDFLPEELPYLLATSDSEQPILEVIVGDSGVGIIQTLEEPYRRGPGQIPGNLTRNKVALPHNVVRWAFDRWSTEKTAPAIDRGVRGLFRVDRLVAKYFGQVSVRTDRTLFVREHLVSAPPLERYNKAPKRFARQPGTLLRIRMTGVTPPGIAELLSRDRPNRDSEAAAPLHAAAPPEAVVVADLYDDGFSDETARTIVESLSHPTARPTALYVFFATSQVRYRSLEAALRFLCRNASSSPVCALNLRCSIDELDTLAASINAQYEDATAGASSVATEGEQFDCVMAVHETGATRWIGLPAAIAKLLEGIGTGDAVPIPNSLYAPVLKIERRLSNFFAIEAGGDAAPFRLLRCKADLRHFRDRVTAQFKQTVDAQPLRKSGAVWTDGPYLTPTLHYVQPWVRVDKIVAALDPAQFEQVAFELSRALYERFRKQSGASAGLPRSSMLAVEERASHRLRDSIQARFRFGRFPHPSEGLIELSAKTRNSPVVVYADLVSSGESVRRAAQDVLRSGFSIAALIALVDTRTDPTDWITAFGQPIPLVTLVHLPNESNDTGPFSVIAPSLLNVEARYDSTQELLAACKIRRDAQPYIWESLSFFHSVRTSRRHLTLTLDPAALLKSKPLITELERVLRTVSFFDSVLADNGSVLVITPVDERDETWASHVTATFAAVRIGKTIEVAFIARATLGSLHAIGDFSSIAPKVKRSSMVVIFDWGLISGRTVDALAMGAIEAGAPRVLIIVANSQLSQSEERLRRSINKLSRSQPGEQTDLLSPSNTTTQEVPYAFVSLNNLPLGHYAESDCPVCGQANDLLSIQCADPFIVAYREGALRRLQVPKDSDTPAPPGGQVVQWVAALRALLVESQSSTSHRLTLQRALHDAATVASSSKHVSPLHAALIDLLYVEGTWIQQPPIRYRATRESVAAICIHLVAHGRSEARAKAVSVLRRVSKTEFIRRAPELFNQLKGEHRAQGALLFGVHTYLARRYHESVEMLDPARTALAELDRQVSADDYSADPTLTKISDSVRYLSFQAEFLGSRARSKKLDVVSALHALRDEFSPSKYFAHGLHYEAIETLGSIQFWDNLRRRMSEEKSGGTPLFPLPSLLDELLLARVRAWRTIHKFLTVTVVPLAFVARTVFESKHFQGLLRRGEAPWFLALLDSHSSGLAPELSPDRLLRELQTRRVSQSSAGAVAQLLDLLEDSQRDVDLLLRIIFQARQLERDGKPATPPAVITDFLEKIESNVHSALQDAMRELESRHDRRVTVTLARHTTAADYAVCCHQDLLRSALSELLNNLGKHGALLEGQTVHGTVACELRGDDVIVEVRNPMRSVKNPIPDPLRHGLATFRKELSHFGGHLDHGERNGQFVASLLLKRWR